MVERDAAEGFSKIPPAGISFPAEAEMAGGLVAALARPRRLDDHRVQQPQTAYKPQKKKKKKKKILDRPAR